MTSETGSRFVTDDVWAEAVEIGGHILTTDWLYLARFHYRFWNCLNIF